MPEIPMQPRTPEFRPGPPRGMPPARSAAARAVPAAGTGAEVRPWPVKWVYLFLLVHPVLAYLMRYVGGIALVHGLVVLGAGLWICFRKNQPLAIMQWCAYMTGAEVLWRMCKAPLPWEFAKHGIWLICLISLLRNRPKKFYGIALIYFALLLPAIGPTFMKLSLDEARQQIAFYLAAQLCLAVCAVRFFEVPVTTNGLQRISLMLVAPVTGIAFLVLFKLATSTVAFGTFSNFAASGGYGPNQVSAMLGLAAFLGVFLFLGEKRSKMLRYFFAAVAFWLLGQAVMTFSRTGLYLFVACFCTAAIFLAQARGKGMRFILILFLLGAVGYLAFPVLNAFTGGELMARYEEKDLTGRDQIAAQEVELWLESPVLGQGVGVSTYLRGIQAGGDVPPSHTEYTRLLADHGLFGVTALILLVGMTGQAFFKAKGPWAKAVVASLAAYCFLFMVASGMRLVTPGFLLGLIHAQFQEENPLNLRLRRRARQMRRVMRLGMRPNPPRPVRNNPPGPLRPPQAGSLPAA